MNCLKILLFTIHHSRITVFKNFELNKGEVQNEEDIFINFIDYVFRSMCN